MIEESFSPLFVGLGWVSLMLLAGVFLRAKLGVFQRFLFPACLIGGIIGFVLISVDIIALDHSVFTLAAFHLFALGFTSVGLTGNEDEGTTEGGGAARKLIRGGIWMALLWTAVISLQSLSGVGIIYGLNTVMEPIYAGLGVLVGHGYTQGPGQALAIAAAWEGTYNIPDAISISLSFAAVGFLVSAIVGVPLANWGLRKGYATHSPKELPKDFLVGLFKKGEGIEAGKQTTQPANVDALAFQLSLLLGVYFLTYLECVALNNYIFPDSLKPLTFGLIFFYAMINGIIARKILRRLGAVHLIDNNIQRRITGTTIDFMIVATLMAVKVAAVWKYIVPISLIILVISGLTFYIIKYFGCRSGEYQLERTLAMFGYCTGTAASGLLLLRIVDPEFKTPVSTEVGMMNLFLTFLCPHIVPMHAILPTLSFGVSGMMGIHLATIAIMLILLKVMGFWKKPVWAQ